MGCNYKFYKAWLFYMNMHCMLSRNLDDRYLLSARKNIKIVSSNSAHAYAYEVHLLICTVAHMLYNYLHFLACWL